MYSTILVPLDGSKRAEMILPHAEELAHRYKAKVIFLRVVEPPDLAVDIDLLVREARRRAEEAESSLTLPYKESSARGTYRRGRVRPMALS